MYVHSRSLPPSGGRSRYLKLSIFGFNKWDPYSISAVGGVAVYLALLLIFGAYPLLHILDNL